MEGTTSLEREIARLRTEVANVPDNIDIKLQYGHACLIRDWRLEALRVYQEVLDVEENAQARLALAKIYALQGYYAESYEELRRLFKVDPISLQGHIMLHLLQESEPVPEDLAQHLEFMPSVEYLTEQRKLLLRDRDILDSQIAEYSALVFGVAEPEPIQQYCVLEARQSKERLVKFLTKCDEWGKSALPTGEHKYETSNDGEVPAVQANAENDADSSVVETAEAVEATEAENAEASEAAEAVETVEAPVEAVEATETETAEVTEAVEAAETVEAPVEAVEATETETAEVTEAVEAVETVEAPVEAVEATETETAEVTEVAEAVETVEAPVEAVEATETETAEIAETVENIETPAETVEATETETVETTEVAETVEAPEAVEEEKVEAVEETPVASENAEASVDKARLISIMEPLLNSRGVNSALIYRRNVGTLASVGTVVADDDTLTAISEGMVAWDELNSTVNCWILEGMGGMVYIQKLNGDNVIVIDNSSTNLGTLRLGIDKIVPSLEEVL